MQNPFEIFSLPISFNLDQDLLNERYLEQQKVLHPDNFVNADPIAQCLAMQRSADINDALQQLKDPILRAEAIIALHLGEQNLEQKSTQDVSFLIQQLQWRETLEDIEQKRDEVALEEFSEQVKCETSRFLTALSASLESEKWKEAEQLCDKLRFIRKLTEQIGQVEEHLFSF
ncbi:Fe-S protein assembly co-chaperone HscB [Rodentibacter caecimuris]|uniref:Co-chaperone protein HscB homolog n=1 Tax=Rodentibacter caecimuris TaxID=1796644 RepID=A0ABX3L0B5_9PAST|nr:Fe-S protein assembly co-chaperone HscB [Rodentibacter heylii]